MKSRFLTWLTSVFPIRPDWTNGVCSGSPEITDNPQPPLPANQATGLEKQDFRIITATLWDGREIETRIR